MPAAAGGVKTACVTGGNGYIASALIKMLLDKGYAVRNPGLFFFCGFFNLPLDFG